MTMTDVPAKARDGFMERFIPEPNSGCWLWLGPVNWDNYGTMTLRGRGIGAHRFSWLIHRGQIPEGMRVLHKCDVRCCVNPDHLFLGTQIDNIHDMIAKNRHRGPRGRNNRHVKLTEDQVRLIRKSSEPQKDLAARFKVTGGLISMIRTRTVWKHLGED